jgi:hypothetical protein
MASFRSGSQPIGKLLPSLIWIHSQYVTPKRKPVFVLKQPSGCGFLLAAQPISGVLNRLRDYSRCQSTEGICSPLDLGERIGFHRNSHFGSSPVHNPRDGLPHREGSESKQLSEALKAITIPMAMDFCATQRQIDRGTEGCEAQVLCSEKRVFGS